ncbi:hypothetical protein [Flavobacterium cutihirudinis]|uniref:hypothetical protein n=1 Tax=Flavobacterium cutihirudinis TaxID=1265740 RepID=UPI0011C0641D|nr:hypothetical protein [Flavobacterium cutihirudinis]
MKKILTLLILFCLLISCERKEPNFSEEMIEKLALRDNEKDGQHVFIPYGFSDVYLMTNHDEIFMTTENGLYASYKLFYSKKYKSFKTFLETFLAEDFVFDQNSRLIIEKKFKLNKKVQKEYVQLGFEKFLKKYSEPSYKKGEFELKKAIIGSDEYSTISYILYLNRYDISFDDIHVRSTIIKREDSFK